MAGAVKTVNHDWIDQVCAFGLQAQAKEFVEAPERLGALRQAEQLIPTVPDQAGGGDTGISLVSLQAE